MFPGQELKVKDSPKTRKFKIAMYDEKDKYKFVEIVSQAVSFTSGHILFIGDEHGSDRIVLGVSSKEVKEIEEVEE